MSEEKKISQPQLSEDQRKDLDLGAKSWLIELPVELVEKLSQEQPVCVV